MNITKEYIDLCKNPKVQGLRPELKCDDKILWHNEIQTTRVEVITPNKSDWLRSYAVWLPTGDDLDQCIIKQLDDGSDYTFIYTNFSKEAGHYNTIVYEGGEVKEQITGETNPLICKLKLLLSLLESEG